MMQGWRILITLILVLCVGCSNDPEDSSQAGSASPSPDASQAANVPAPPEVGQCRNTPDSNLDDDDWVDDTPVVDCSETHTLQTVEVIDIDEELTVELLEELADTCDTLQAWDYLDSPAWPERATYNLMFAAYGPTPEQQEAGQSWMRCDVGIPSKSECCRPLAPQTESVEGAMGEDPARFQLCIAKRPDPDRSQPLVSCAEPHRAELIQKLMERDASEYPSASELEKTGQARCGDLVTDRDDADQLVLTPVWQPEEEWPGGTLYGWCWIQRETGLLPAR